MRRIALYLRQNGMGLVLALLLSWLVWFQVSSFFVETKRIEVKVRIIPEDPGRLVMLGHAPDTVTLELSGNRRLMDRIDATSFTADFRVRMEFLDKSGRPQTRTFTKEDLNLPRDLDLRLMEPPEVTVQFAERAEKLVPVVADVDASKLAQAAPDLELRGDPIVWPDTMKVEGPRAIVEALTEIRTTRIELDRVLMSQVPLPPQEPELSPSVPLDLKSLDAQGVSTRERSVRVLLRFAWAYRKKEKVRLEVHWVDPDPVNDGRTVKIDETRGAVTEDTDGKLWLEVTLVGPKVSIEDQAAIGRIRVFVRSDEALPLIADPIPQMKVIHFEGLPPGVRVEPVPPESMPWVKGVTYEAKEKK
jgi:hypothetical protein